MAIPGRVILEIMLEDLDRLDTDTEILGRRFIKDLPRDDSFYLCGKISAISAIVEGMREQIYGAIHRGEAEKKGKR